jgi:hypothetical protein
MSKIISHTVTENGSEKSFGITFSIVFLVIALYLLINSQALYLWAFIISTVFLMLALIAPKTLIIPNLLWFKFGMLLGSIIAPIVMSLIYFFTVLPTGLIMRLLGKDLLRLKIDKNTNSYWIMRNESMGSMKNQF